MTRAILLVLLATLLAAPPARAQLGIVIAGEPAAKDAKKSGKKDAKKKSDKRKRESTPSRHGAKAAPAPAERTSPPGESAERREPVAPAPVPAPPPAAAVPAPGPERATDPEPAAPPPAAARPSRKERTQQQPGLTLTPLDEKASAAGKERLDAAKKLLDARATETAALAFDEILDRGPSGTRYFQTSMEWLFWVGRRLPNEQPLLTRVARHAAQGIPPAYEDRVNYILARYEFERGRALADAGRVGEAKAAWAESRRLAAKVHEEGVAAAAPKGQAHDAPEQEGGDVYARARFVDGLVAYAQGNDAAATEQFKEVVRLTNPRKARTADPELRELAFLQLARIHYQNRQNRYAIFYYGKMPWGGERWLEGLWEASYAHYRIGDYEKTLGNLLTLQSPYFKDEYYPESYVLKAIVYYENCRYPEARQVLEKFSSIYDPVYAELTRLTGATRTPDAYYELVRGSAASGGVARKILKLAETDQNVARLVDSIGAAEAEMDVGLGARRPEFRSSALGKDLHDRLAAERVALVEEAGQRMRGKLEYERDQLRQLLAQALRIQIEVSRKEREALEGSLAKGSQVEVVRDLKYSYAVSDEHLYWPYEGEFWRDELGTYSYTLTKGCKDRLPRKAAAR